MSTQKCVKRTMGGKGNFGKFIDRNPRLCAAGVPTRQPEITIQDGMQQFLLADEVNALIGDAIIPPPPPRPLAPVYYPVKKDQRYCGSSNSDLALLVNPPQPTKFQVLVKDLKETSYSSYWKKPIGRRQDCTHILPKGFDIQGTTFGRKTPVEATLYETILPTDPLPGQCPPSKKPGVQTCRNYCRPAFNPDLYFGYKSKTDRRGMHMKRSLTDDRVVIGKIDTSINNTVQADRTEAFQPSIGSSLQPYNNISLVPEGHRFGKVLKSAHVKDCLATCDLNPGKDFFLECLAHLNAVRKGLKTILLPSYFKTMYNNLKYMDQEKSGWLPADVVLEFALTKHIRVDLKLLGPLLEAWNAFDGKRIKYKTFCHVLNFKARMPDLPKIEDVPPECLDFRTTYSEMIKPGQALGEHFMAGLPSGRYFDQNYPAIVEGQCSAHKTCLSMESDVYSCLSPSIMTLLHVSHRDMYAKREPHVVRRVFEASGEEFTEERFNTIWEEAKKYHSQGLVCYETFQRALNKISEEEQNIRDLSENMKEQKLA